jgi:hypothetical protein
VALVCDSPPFFKYSKLPFDNAFNCARTSCGNPPPTQFFVKLLAAYKYHDKEAVAAIGISPILWVINSTRMGDMANNEAIKMIDHFIKMGFDINAVEKEQFNMTSLKAAILYKNVELVVALLQRGARIQMYNPDINALSYALKLQKIDQTNANMTPEQHQKLKQIILFLEEKASNEQSS